MPRISTARGEEVVIESGGGKKEGENLLAPSFFLKHFGYWSFGSSAVIPSAHQYMQVLQGEPNSLKPSRSSCSSETPAARISTPLLSWIGPLNTSKRVNLPSSAALRVS